MQGSLKNHIFNYHRLILLTVTPLLIGLSTLLSTAAPVKIAQVSAAGNINRPTLKVGSQGERVSELQAALKLLGFYTGTVDGIYSEKTASAVSQFKQAAGLSPDGVVDSITWQKLFPSTTPITPTVTATSQPTPSSTPNKPRTTTAVTLPSTNNRTTRTNTTPQKPNNPKPNVVSQNQKRPNNPKPNVVSQNQNTGFIQPTPKNRQIPGIQYTDAGWPILRLGMRGQDVLKLQQLLQRLGFLKTGIDGDFGLATEAAVKAAQTRYGLEADGVVGGATWETFIKRYSQQP